MPDGASRCAVGRLFSLTYLLFLPLPPPSALYPVIFLFFTPSFPPSFPPPFPSPSRCSNLIVLSVPLRNVFTLNTVVVLSICFPSFSPSRSCPFFPSLLAFLSLPTLLASLTQPFLPSFPVPVYSSRPSSLLIPVYPFCSKLSSQPLPIRSVPVYPPPSCLLFPAPSPLSSLPSPATLAVCCSPSL